MQRIERYGVIALVFLLVTILAVSLWGEGEGRAKGILTSLRGGTGEEVAAAERDEPERAPARKTPLTGPLTGPRRAAPMSTPDQADPDGRPKKRGRGKSPEVGAPSQGARSGAAPARSLPTPTNVAAARSRAQAPATQPEPERARLVQRNAAPEPASVSRGRFYVVRPNETLSEIAQRELGTYKRWTEIQALNGGLDPAKLRQGMKLRLPARGSDAAAARVAQAVQPPAKKPQSTPAATVPVVNGQGSYTVRSGDVLGVIAQRELGSAKRWPEIVALNPGLDPDRVPVGTRLVMPAGAARVQQVAVADTSRVSPPQQSATPARARGKVR